MSPQPPQPIPTGSLPFKATPNVSFSRKPLLFFSNQIHFSNSIHSCQARFRNKGMNRTMACLCPCRCPQVRTEGLGRLHEPSLTYSGRSGKTVLEKGCLKQAAMRSGMRHGGDQDCSWGVACFPFFSLVRTSGYAASICFQMGEAIKGRAYLWAPAAVKSSQSWLQAQPEPGPDVTRPLPLQLSVSLRRVDSNLALFSRQVLSRSIRRLSGNPGQ